MRKLCVELEISELCRSEGKINHVLKMTLARVCSMNYSDRSYIRVKINTYDSEVCSYEVINLESSFLEFRNLLVRTVVLVHDTRSNDSRCNDARFMHESYLSLHAINRPIGEYSLHHIEKLKNLTE